MSVVAVREKIAGRHSSYGADNAREYYRTFTVETNHHGDSDYLVRLATGLPRIGTYWQIGDEYDVGALAIEISANQVAKYFWEVVVRYASIAPGGQDPAQFAENPLERPAEVDWGNEPFTEIVEFGTDEDRTPVLNSQHRPYDPPIERESFLLSLTVVRNEAEFDSADAAASLNPPAINSDAFFGHKPFTARIMRYDAQSQFENGVSFWRVTRKFIFNDETWDKVVLDTGVVVVEDDTGSYTDQVLLDGEGGILDDYDFPVYNTHRIYKPRVFAQWNLP